MKNIPKIIIFTDLDGSLLNHHDYSCDAALEFLAELEAADIPVIFSTSKTRVEVKAIRDKLENKHPYIVENGAGILIPEDYPIPVDGTLQRNGCDFEISFGSGREHWSGLLSSLKQDFPGCYRTFADLSVHEISELTGLTQNSALLASKREYSEPVVWSGSKTRLDSFKTRLLATGATVVSGGRFLHVGDSVSKGKALQWLASRYTRIGSVITIAVGDSENDVSMLEAANHAVVVKSATGSELSLTAETNKAIIFAKSVAPLGWVEGVSEVLDQIRFSTQQSKI